MIPGLKIFIQKQTVSSASELFPFRDGRKELRPAGMILDGRELWRRERREPKRRW